MEDLLKCGVSDWPFVIAIRDKSKANEVYWIDSPRQFQPAFLVIPHQT